MLGRFLTAGLAAVLAVTALSGCGGAGEGGATSPSPAMTRTQAPLDRAKDALLTAQEIPVPPPSDTVEIPSSYSAQGDQVSAPWPQFMICSSVGKADEGPPSVVEPGAAAETRPEPRTRPVKMPAAPPPMAARMTCGFIST